MCGGRAAHSSANLAWSLPPCSIDTWSGWSGQFLTVLSQLYLAHLTQRVAIMCVCSHWPS